MPLGAIRLFTRAGAALGRGPVGVVGREGPRGGGARPGKTRRSLRAVVEQCLEPAEAGGIVCPAVGAGAGPVSASLAARSCF